MLQCVIRSCYLHRRCIGFVHNIARAQYHDQSSTQLSYERNISSSVKPSTQTVSDDNEDFENFMLAFPKIAKDLTEAQLFKTNVIVGKRFSDVLNYNVSNGTKFRGMNVVSSIKMLEKFQNGKSDMKLAYILGWCVEMVQSALVIQDDIEDQSETRRGKLCWYKLPDVGLRAINDSLMLQSAIYLLLRKYFSTHQYYIEILELFHETFLIASLGQSLDLLSVINEQPQFESFTMDRYTWLVLNKSAYLTTVLPTTAALLFSERYEHALYAHIRPILEEVGLLFQAMDDFLDCFGNYEKMGKIGTDIRNGKCSWLAVTALQYATPKQKELFKQHYGKLEVVSEQEIRKLYCQIGLPQMYSQFEAELTDSIYSKISKIPKQSFLQNLLTKIMENLILYSSNKQ